MKYFVYILKCADDSLYAGATNNLEKRVKQHNSAKAGAHYTKIRRPVRLVYSEQFKTLLKARQREAEVKSWRRGKKLTLIGDGDES
jgi:putative endonuclease